MYYSISSLLFMILTLEFSWNSIHDMLNRLIELRPVVHAVCRLEQLLRSYLLSDEDWNLLSRLQSILDIFVKATEYLSGSSYPTLSVQLPYFAVLAS
ncbi:hypothetical protein L211DRAFT_873845 [Terfezia boudieri ATCC MYA-4762]|uniref:Uncharacterized protein n=1 Tax=Terfezia boudieri ATCC MYA-4762 TaxID=1051890 RepID=A0A3N4M4P5_9PEZI|nr:hypothetical protein L211DRAFT_873845 [Terfezia boudieri ATCC MYA-4762]